MARRGKSRSKRSPKRIPVRAVDGSELCLQCGLCCDGTLFAFARLYESEREFTESLGLEVAERPGGAGLGAVLPCPRFVDGCCSLYTVPRPAICGDYQCALLTGYVAGTRRLDEVLPVVQLVRSLTRELEVEMGIPAGAYTRSGVLQYLAEIEPWIVAPGAPTVPQELVRFLGAFSRLNLLGVKYFGYEPVPLEVKTAAVGEQVAAGAVTGVG